MTQQAEKHTPGPWRLSTKSPKTIIQDLSSIGLEDGILIGSAAGHPNSGFFPTEEEAEANARLMAAAPELLEALEGVLRVADRATNEFDAARAAIAKATGASA